MAAPTITQRKEAVVARPERRQMSYATYLEFAIENQIVEWVDGEAIIMPTPTLEHQKLVNFLNRLLITFIEFFDLGQLVVAPFEVKLWEDGPARQPDLLFIGTENTSKLASERFRGAPDLAVEVISPSSVTEDRVRKFREYEQAGVREYWLVDPRPHQQQAEFFVLDENGVYQPAPLDVDGRFFSTVLPHFWLNVEWLKQTELPNPQLVLAEIMLSIADLPDEARKIYEGLQAFLTASS